MHAIPCLYQGTEWYLELKKPMENQREHCHECPGCTRVWPAKLMLLGGLFTCCLSPALLTTVLSQICLIFAPSSGVFSLLAVVRDPFEGAVVADNYWESPGCWTEEQSCQIGCCRRGPQEAQAVLEAWEHCRSCQCSLLAAAQLRLSRILQQPQELCGRRVFFPFLCSTLEVGKLFQTLCFMCFP